MGGAHYCFNCGTKNKELRTFCTHCGEPLTQDIKELQRTYANEGVSLNAIMLTQVGFGLAWTICLLVLDPAVVRLFSLPLSILLVATLILNMIFLTRYSPKTDATIVQRLWNVIIVFYALVLAVWIGISAIRHLTGMASDIPDMLVPIPYLLLFYGAGMLLLFVAALVFSFGNARMHAGRSHRLFSCPNCSTTLRIGHKYCYACGADVRGRVCFECAATIVKGHRFCGRCGAEQEIPTKAKVKRASETHKVGSRLFDENETTNMYKPQYRHESPVGTYLLIGLFVLAILALLLPVRVIQSQLRYDLSGVDYTKAGWMDDVYLQCSGTLTNLDTEGGSFSMRMVFYYGGTSSEYRKDILLNPGASYRYTERNMGIKFYQTDYNCNIYVTPPRKSIMNNMWFGYDQLPILRPISIPLETVTV